MSGIDPEALGQLAVRENLLTHAHAWLESPPEDVVAMPNYEYFKDDITSVAESLAKHLPEACTPKDYARISEREIYRRLLSFFSDSGMTLEKINRSAEMLRLYADGWVRTAWGDGFVGQVYAVREADKQQFDALRNNGLLGAALLSLAVE